MAKFAVLLLLFSACSADPLSTQDDSCAYTFFVPREQGCTIVDGEISDLRATTRNLQTQLTSLLEQNTQLIKENVELRRIAEEQLDLLEGRTGSKETSEEETEGPHGTCQGCSSSSASFVRWGRTVCPDNSSTVYTGYAAGSHYTHGGGISELLCLPEQPQWGQYYAGNQFGSYLYGTEYQSGTSPQVMFDTSNHGGERLHDDNVPCAVCLTDGRGEVRKFPAMSECPAGWHFEYGGYLMAGHHTHNNLIPATCVDGSPEALDGGDANEDGALLYFMEVICGSLPCPPYVNSRELTCAICSR